MILLFILLGIFIVVGGGINYVCAILNKKKSTKKQLPGLFIAFFVDSVIMTVINVILLRNPQLIYTYIHWGWILGINIGLFVLAVIMGILLGVKGFKMIMATTQLIVGVCALTLMIFGLCLSHKTVYTISTASEFNILSNLPNSERHAYQIKIIDDIDFSGVDVSKGLGNDDCCFIIDGQGHIIKNIKYETIIDDGSKTFFTTGSAYKNENKNNQTSKISNLTIQDCEFIITPNYYSTYSREGEECYFGLFTYKAEDHLSQVNIINTKVYVKRSIPNIRYEGLSTIKEISPSNTSVNGCNISIEITYEE